MYFFQMDLRVMYFVSDGPPSGIHCIPEEGGCQEGTALVIQQNLDPFNRGKPH